MNSGYVLSYLPPLDNCVEGKQETEMIKLINHENCCLTVNAKTVMHRLRKIEAVCCNHHGCVFQTFRFYASKAKLN